MSVTKILKKIADKKLEKIGFRRRIETNSPCVWTYERQLGDKKQELLYQKRIHFKEIEFRVDYGDYITDIVDVAHVFSPEVLALIQKNSLGSVPYEDERELELIITEFTDVIIEKVLPLYDIIIRPDQYPSLELQKELYGHVSFYADMFVQRYHLNYEASIAGIKKCVLKLEKLIDESRHLTGDTLNELLLCTSAYYAELTDKVHKGEWIEDEYGFFLEFVGRDIYGNMVKIPTSPLIDVYYYWQKPEVYSKRIIAGYKHTLWCLGIEKRYSPD